MFGLGTTELIVIAFVIVLLFGGKKLPALGKSMGSAINNFKKGLSDKSEDKEEKEESRSSKDA